MVSLNELHMALKGELLPIDPAQPVSHRHISGVHISELLDPTPYMSGGELLLTTGIPFEFSQEPVEDYVSRLKTRKVGALGFGVGPVCAQVPPALIQACSRQGLELLLVPQEATFQHITRTYWQLADQGGQAELKRTLGLQTALVREVIRPDGVSAVLRRLGQSIGGWAAYLPAGKGAEKIWPESASGYLQKIRDVSRSKSSRVAVNAPVTFELNGQIVLKYPISSGEKNYGQLLVGSPRRLTAADAQITATVCMLLLMKIRQRETYAAGVATLGSALVRLLLNGQADAARLLAESVGLGELPARMHLVGLKGDSQEEPTEWIRTLPLLERSSRVPVLDSALEETPFRLHEEGILYLLVAEKAAQQAQGRASNKNWSQAASLRAMMSPPVLLQDLPAAAEAVSRALRRAEPGSFGMIGGQDRTRADEWVAILADYKRADLLGTVAAYVRHRGQWEPTSRELGVHRNSVRHRIEAAQELLGLDLNDPDVFAPLWLALRDQVD